MTPAGRFAPHQLEVEGAEAHAAQRTQQVELALQLLAVALGLPAGTSAQLQLQLVAAAGEGAHLAAGLAVLDQITIATGAVGAQAAK